MPPTDKTRARVLDGLSGKLPKLNNLQGYGSRKPEGAALSCPSGPPRPCTPNQGIRQIVLFWNSPSSAGASSLETLLEIAVASNLLARQLTLSNRHQAYQIKALATGALIRAGSARVNGVLSGDLVGIDIEVGARRARVHMRLSELPPDARAIARDQRGIAPAKASLKDLTIGKFGDPTATEGPRS